MTGAERNRSAGTLISSVLILFVAGLIVITTDPVRSGERANAFCDSVERYILRVDDIAYGVDDPGKRKLEYAKALARLMAAARSRFGPSCPCKEIEADAMAQRRVVESHRRPPPGWDPDATAENLLLFTRISRQTLAAQMNLTRWCWVKDRNGDAPDTAPAGRKAGSPRK